MKKFLFILTLMGACAGFAHADAQGTMGTIGGQKLWKSSQTASNDQVIVSSIGHVFLATPYVGTPGSTSFVVYTNGQGSTITIKMQTTSTNQNASSMIFTSTSGWGYKSYGGTPAEIAIPWDFKNMPPPEGLTP